MNTSVSGRLLYLAEPPRRVPWNVIASLVPGFIGRMGAAFYLSGMIFVVVFAGTLRPIDEVQLASAAATAQGVVVSVTETNATENDVPVYRYGFVFRTRTEQEIRATSFSTGRLYDQGDEALISYLPDRPEVAILQHTRRSDFPWWVALLVGIFPFSGAVMLIGGTWHGWRQVRLLERGRLATARGITSAPTNTRINGQPLLKYTYEFQAEDGQVYQGASNSLPRVQLGDEAREPVLYLPQRPQNSMLLDAVPLRYALTTNTEGHWESDGNLWPIFWSGLIAAGVVVSWVFMASLFV